MARIKDNFKERTGFDGGIVRVGSVLVSTAGGSGGSFGEKTKRFVTRTVLIGAVGTVAIALTKPALLHGAIDALNSTASAASNTAASASAKFGPSGDTPSFAPIPTSAELPAYQANPTDPVKKVVKAASYLIDPSNPHYGSHGIGVDVSLKFDLPKLIEITGSPTYKDAKGVEHTYTENSISVVDYGHKLAINKDFNLNCIQDYGSILAEAQQHPDYFFPNGKSLTFQTQTKNPKKSKKITLTEDLFKEAENPYNLAPYTNIPDDPSVPNLFVASTDVHHVTSILDCKPLN